MTSEGRGRLYAADLARIAVFAALIAALGLPGTWTPLGANVPITAQTLGVMLAGALLGSTRGALACLVFLALVAAGLPLLAGGRGGLGVLFDQGFGYRLAWPVGAFVIGWLTERMLPRYRFWPGLAAIVLGGIVVVYLFGLPVLAWRTDLSTAKVFKLGMLIYLPGDSAKAVIAALVAQQVHRAYPALARTGRDDLDDLDSRESRDDRAG